VASRNVRYKEYGTPVASRNVRYKEYGTPVASRNVRYKEYENCKVSLETVCKETGCKVWWETGSEHLQRRFLLILNIHENCCFIHWYALGEWEVWVCVGKILG
jgi:hypothetical protein